MFCKASFNNVILFNFLPFFRPTITIENGKSEEKVVPVNQVRPIKKDSKKAEEKNNLDVVAVDYRRHKSVEHKREKSSEKHKSDHTKNNGAIKKETKPKDDAKKQDRITKRTRTISASKKKTIENETNEEGSSKPNAIKDPKSKGRTHDKEKVDAKECHIKKASHKHDARPRRTSSSEKKLVKSAAVCDESDVVDVKDAKMIGDKSKAEKSKNVSSASGSQLNFSNIDHSEQSVKPPNILVYADSFVAKENVKVALASILNRDK